MSDGPSKLVPPAKPFPWWVTAALLLLAGLVVLWCIPIEWLIGWTLAAVVLTIEHGWDN